MMIYNRSDLKCQHEEVSVMKYLIGFVVAVVIIYGPLTVLWLN